MRVCCHFSELDKVGPYLSAMYFGIGTFQNCFDVLIKVWHYNYCIISLSHIIMFPLHLKRYTNEPSIHYQFYTRGIHVLIAKPISL